MLAVVHGTPRQWEIHVLFAVRLHEIGLHHFSFAPAGHACSVLLY